MVKLPQKNVLRYQKGRRSQETVRRHYLEWRSQQTPPIPLRCDNPKCFFYKNALEWNHESINVILDHKNGVHGDNRPKNLQFLCPNCNSQQPTHGGGNKGKVEQNEGGFAKISKDGKKDYTLPSEPGDFTIKGGQVTLVKGSENA